MPDEPDGADADAGDTGDVDSAVLPCERNDIEVVSDLDEPPAIEFESAHEEETDPGLIFSAVIVEPDGNVISVAVPAESASEADEARAGGEEIPEEPDEGEAAAAGT